MANKDTSHDVVSHPGEAKLRKAFKLLDLWTAQGLTNRLLEEDIDLASLNAARVLICQGHQCGLLKQYGKAGSFSYSLNKEWMRPGWSKPGNGYVAGFDSAPVRVKPITFAAGKPAAAYTGPAFGGGLIPNMGLVCEPTQEERDGEMTPHMGMRLVDSLDRQFNAMFPGIE